MKRLATVALLFVVGCSTMQLPEAPEELPSEQAFQGTNVTWIETDNSPEEARSKMIQTFQLQDYSIDRTLHDTDNLVTTQPRTFGSGVAGSARYTAEIMDDGRIKLTGKFVQSQVGDRTGFEQYQSYTVTPRGDRLSTSRVAWRAMREIAEGYNGGTVMYDKEPNV